MTSLVWLAAQAVCTGAIGWLAVANLPGRGRRDVLGTDLEWPLAFAAGVVALASLQFALFLLAVTSPVANGAALGIALTGLAVRPLRARRFPDAGRAGAVLMPFGLYLGYLLLITALTPSYATGETADWALYWPNVWAYMRLVPLDQFTEALSLEYLVKRTPILSLYAGFWVRFGEVDYAAFQRACLVPNALLFLAVWTWAGRRYTAGTREIAAAILVLAPAAVRLGTVPEPKALAAALVLIALLEHSSAPVGGWRRAIAGFLSCAAVMTHPSAAFFLVWPYALRLWRNLRRTEAVDRWLWTGTALSVVVLVAPWVAWAVHTFGAGAVLGPNRTLAGDAPFSPSTYLAGQIGMAATTVLLPLGMFESAAISNGGWTPWGSFGSWLAEFADAILRSYDQTFLAGTTLTIAIAVIIAVVNGKRRGVAKHESDAMAGSAQKPDRAPAVALLLGGAACLAANVAIIDFKGHATNQLAPLFLAVVAFESAMLRRYSRRQLLLIGALAAIELLAVRLLILALFGPQGRVRDDWIHLYDTINLELFGSRALGVVLVAAIWLSLYMLALRRSHAPAPTPQRTAG